MEFAFPELLTREEILRVLQERKLSGIANLPDNELLRVFKAFAVPLAKRNVRAARQNIHPKRSAVHDEMDIDDPQPLTKQIKYHLDDETESIFYYREKRPFAFEDCLDDESLSSATKRIKITWP